MPHTPGPWNWEDEGPETNIFACNGKVLIANFNDEIDECLDNADLISAAPELLSALEAIMGHYPYLCSDEHGNPPSEWEQQRITAARAAIAKAKGEDFP